MLWARRNRLKLSTSHIIYTLWETLRAHNTLSDSCQMIISAFFDRPPLCGCTRALSGASSLATLSKNHFPLSLKVGDRRTDRREENETVKTCATPNASRAPSSFNWAAAESPSAIIKSRSGLSKSPHAPSATLPSGYPPNNNIHLWIVNSTHAHFTISY